MITSIDRIKMLIIDFRFQNKTKSFTITNNNTRENMIYNKAIQ